MTAPADIVRSRLAKGRLMVPGCHDPLSARLAAEAGAATAFLAGSAVGRALFDESCVPRDRWREYLRYVEIVCRAVPVPVLVDAEDGFGEPVATAVRLAEAGAAGVVIGDSMPDGELRPADAFATELTEIRRRTGLLVAARTDGIAHDRDETRWRLRQYREAGADLTLAMLSPLLATETVPELLATIECLAGAAAGTLTIHARRLDDLPPVSSLPRTIAAVLITGVSVPGSISHVSRVLTAR